MKNTKLLSIMLVFAISALLSLACNKTDPTPTEEKIVPYIKSELVKTYELSIEGKNYSLVGDTILPYQETRLHPLPSTKPDLSNISGNNSEIFRYVAIGASLSSGVKDGGWSNDGILTSYPNLIARQMVLSNFRQSLFNDKEFNGYGLKLPTPNKETPIPRYKAVSNNLALKTTGIEIILSPFESKELNNFAVPNLTDGGVYDDLKSNTFDNTYFKLYLKRILTQPQASIETQINLADIVSLEVYQQSILKYALSGGKSNQHFPELYPFAGNNPLNISEISYTGGADQVLYKLYKKNIKKAILINIPHPINLPYFKNSVRFSAIKSTFTKLNIADKDYGFDVNEKIIFLPTASLDTLFTYQNSKEKFLSYYLKGLSNNLLTDDIQKDIDLRQTKYNEHITFLGKKYSVPVVDIKTIYAQVSNGTYLTEEGRKVSDKEFFSSDGLYPNAFGQSIIANECIKTINTFYKTNIQLIKTEFYFKK